MRIGYVLKVYPRLSQTFIVNELRAHERAGANVTVVSLKQPKEEDAGVVQPPLGLPVLYLEGPEERWPDQLAALAKEREIDHFHAHFGNVAAHTARLASQQTGIPYSYTAHALDIFAEKVVHEELARKIYDAQTVVTVSDFNVKYLTRTFGRRPALVYNGMPLATFTYRRPRPPTNTILAIGRLIEKKGFADLIDACAELVRRNQEFTCRIIGDGALYDDFKARIALLGLDKRVHLLGALPPDSVRDHLERATLLAAPCVVAANGDRDGLPTVLLEAMAVGTPCISTDVTGIPEVVIHERTGLQTPRRNPGALADALERLLSDAPLADRLARNARRLIEDKFDSDKTAARLRQLWERPPRRLLFRIHNRKGMGHLMRSLNIAHEILTEDPDHDILFYVRSTPPIGLGETAGIRYLSSDNPDDMPLDRPAIEAFAPHLIVDDTILPADTFPGARRVYVMRRSTEEKQQAIFETPALKEVDAVLVPHTEAEFGHELPAWLREKTVFVGPIVRPPKEDARTTLCEKYGIEAGDFLLVSTPGGGGFDADAALFFDVATRVHRLLRDPIPGLRHVVVRGPNASAGLEAVDERMVVVDVEPDMVSLFALADAVVSAGGYNSVQEIRLTKRPAVYLPGRRKYDDQEQRVRELERLGLARVVPEADPADMAARIAGILGDPAALTAMRRCYEKDPFEPGNRKAGKEIRGLV